METKYRDASSTQQELKSQLVSAQQDLDKAQDENLRLRKILRDIARQQAAKGVTPGGGDGSNPFAIRMERNNFPDFDAGMADEHDSGMAQNSGSDVDDNDDDAHNDSGDSFAPLDLSIGGLAAFHGLQDFGVIAPPSLLDSSHAIAELCTPARVIKAEKGDMNQGPGLSERNGNDVTSDKASLTSSPPRSETADLNNESAQSPPNMADMYGKLLAARREDAEHQNDGPGESDAETATVEPHCRQETSFKLPVDDEGKIQRCRESGAGAASPGATSTHRRKHGQPRV